MKSWKGKVIYQIWPRSFQDSNGDGIGDLQGVISRLPYLKDLGIDVIWLSPIYMSPNKDYGYDISDYYQINPEFGTMEDFEELVEKAKCHGIGIMMDLVANHTSDQHLWFQEALSNPNSPYREYYYFRDGKNGGPPNNWMSFFGGSAWTLDPISGQYYMTQFTPEQCDLNWECQEMRQDLYEIMRFWLEKGIIGFRMDVINAISKIEGLVDKNPELKGLQFPNDYTLNRKKTHDYIKEMNAKILKSTQCLSVGEGPLAAPKDVVAYTKETHNELNMMLHFDLHNLGYGELGKYDFRKLYRWQIRDFKNVVDEWQETIQREGGWVGNYLSNHDQNRQVSRFGNDKKYRIESAKALALLNFTLRGTPFIYQGEEIGMTDCTLEEDEWRDYEALNAYKVLQEMMHLPATVAKRIVKKVTRDNSRTPMQWNDELHGGFSTVTPWIKVNPNYETINVKADQAVEKNSIFAFYKKLIAFRQANNVLVEGDYLPMFKKHPKVIGYVRKNKEMALLVLINLSPSKARIEIEACHHVGRLLLGTHEMTHHIEVEGVLVLRPYEGRIYRL